MLLENKKEHILRCVKLGLNLYEAEIITECTEEEIEILDNDDEFKKQVKQQKVLEEYDLLTRQEQAISVAIDRGGSAGVQWKLERINPSRWAGKEEGENPLDDLELNVNLVGKGNDS